MKYKKLLVHKEDREYVSNQLELLFLQEKIAQRLRLLHYYGRVADCISMLQAAFPAFPRLIKFRERDHLN